MDYIIPSASYVECHEIQIWHTAVCTVQTVQVIMCSMNDCLYPAISSDFEILPQYLRYGRYHDVITHHFPIQLQHDKSRRHPYQENSIIAARNVVV